MSDIGGRVVTPPLLLVVSGPSGVGKTSLCHELVERRADACYSISVTTRPRRAGERDGQEYFFRTEEEFDELESRGELLERARVHDHRYGTPARYVDARMAERKVVVLNIDVQGGLEVMKHRPDAASIFVFPPSFGELETRLRSRGLDAEADIRLRLENARGELRHAGRYTYVVVNDAFDACLGRLEAIVDAERSLGRRCYLPDTPGGSD